jgi:hypothetical protein
MTRLRSPFAPSTSSPMRTSSMGTILPDASVTSVPAMKQVPPPPPPVLGM